MTIWILYFLGTEVQQEMLRFPKLHEKIVDVVTQLLRRRLPTTNHMVENLVAIELAYVNTKHPDFHKDAALVPSLLKNEQNEAWQQMQHQKRHGHRTATPVGNQLRDGGAGGDHANHVEQNAATQNHVSETSNSWLSNILPPPSTQRPSESESSTASTPTHVPHHHVAQSPAKAVNLLPDVPMNHASRKLTDKEQKDCDVIERLIKSYFYIIRKSIQDSVPKAIMHFLVNFVKDNLQSELVTHLYKSDKAEDMLNESDHIAIRRKEAADMLQALTRANHIISEIRETHMW